ncbi:MAG: hypothetical protein ACLSHC_14840 [Bilophila wadsworthia]
MNSLRRDIDAILNGRAAKVAVDAACSAAGENEPPNRSGRAGKPAPRHPGEDAWVLDQLSFLRRSCDPGIAPANHHQGGNSAMKRVPPDS